MHNKIPPAYKPQKIQLRHAAPLRTPSQGIKQAYRVGLGRERVCRLNIVEDMHARGALMHEHKNVLCQ